MVWKITYKTIKLITYVIVQVYAKIVNYLITCLAEFLCTQPTAERWTRLFMHNMQEQLAKLDITIGWSK